MGGVTGSSAVTINGEITTGHTGVGEFDPLARIARSSNASNARIALTTHRPIIEGAHLRPRIRAVDVVGI